MKIRGKTVFVYDLEVFPNLFTCTVKNTESKNSVCYEISDLQNDMPEIARLFLNKNILFATFNGIHYDNPLISYILLNYKTLITKPIWEINKELKEFSDLIITSETSASWRKYKYANIFEGIDLLTLMFSSKLRVGLKELQVTMKFPNVEEYDGDFNSNAPRAHFDKIKAYNQNDVNSTEELLYRLQKDIDLRLGIEKEYGVNVLSSDGVSIGKEILKTKYLQDTGKTWAEVKDLRSPKDSLDLKDIILPQISYQTSELQSLLTEMKKTTVYPNGKSWSKTFDFFGTKINVAEGGVHGDCGSEIIIPKEDEILVDWDAALTQWRRIKFLNCGNILKF